MVLNIFKYIIYFLIIIMGFGALILLINGQLLEALGSISLAGTLWTSINWVVRNKINPLWPRKFTKSEYKSQFQSKEGMLQIVCWIGLFISYAMKEAGLSTSFFIAAAAVIMGVGGTFWLTVIAKLKVKTRIIMIISFLLILILVYALISGNGTLIWDTVRAVFYLNIL